MSDLLKLAVSCVAVIVNVHAVDMAKFQLDLDVKNEGQLAAIAKTLHFWGDAFTEHYRAHEIITTPEENDIVRYENLKYYCIC